MRARSASSSSCRSTRASRAARIRADLKMGVQKWHAWKRIALVTDVDWMAHGVHWFGWMTPGDVKHFSVADRAEAIAWAAG